MKVIYPTFVKKESQLPSDDWLGDFKGRWSLKPLKSTDIERARSLGATVSSLRKWFTDIYDLIDLSKYDKSFIGNMDETMISSKSRLLCIVRRTSRYALSIEDENSEHITLVCTVTANGDSAPPFAIFPLKNMPMILDEMVTDNQLIVGGQESGWIDQSKFLHWSKEFIKWVEARRVILNKPNAPFLLFLDSHNSRENVEALQLLKNANIDVVTYPPECSHILQALDVCIFGSFKKHLKIQMRSMRTQKITWKDNLIPSDTSIRRAKTILATLNAWKQACTYTNIQKAFSRSGIHPRDVEAALQNPRLNVHLSEGDTPISLDSTPTRTKLSITSSLITSEEVIQAIINKKDEMKRKKDEKEQ
jgi:hypothetical protein